MDFKEEDIYWALGEYALRFDGYCAETVISLNNYSREKFFKDFEKYFYLPKDKIVDRIFLFLLQRSFAKWGGEQTPEYSRNYSLYYLLYLEVYRHNFPAIFASNWNFCKNLPLQSDETTLENLAGAIRRHFAGNQKTLLGMIDYIITNCFTPSSCGFLTDKKLFSRPEVMLAGSINPILTTKLFFYNHSDYFSNIPTELSAEECEMANLQFGQELSTMTSNYKLSLDDVKNHLFLYILQAWITRHKSSVDSLSAEYILFMFIYLHLYRSELPKYLGQEPFYSAWLALPKSRKEDTAEQFRKKLCLLREERIKKQNIK